MCLQLSDGAPREDWGVRSLVRRIGRQFVGPATAAYERKQGAPVQPSQVNLGLGARSTTDDDASIAGQSHEEIAGISHATGKNNGRGPIRWRHLIWWHDAKHQTVCLDGAFSRDPGCWAAAAADDSDTEFGQRHARLSSKFVGT